MTALSLWRVFGTTVSLVVVWLAVLFVGVFGGDIVTEDTLGGSVGPQTIGTQTAVPVVVAVALLAVIATFFVTWFAYRAEKADAERRSVDLDVKPVRERESAPAPQEGPVSVGHG